MKIWIFFLFLTHLSMAQFEAVDEYLAGLDPEIEITMQLLDAQGQALYAINEDLQVRAASTIKIAILIEFFAQIQQKRFRLHEKYFLKPEDKVGGSGDLQYLAPHSISYEDLASEMIRLSDNTATNILIDKLGMSNINGFLKYFGLETTELTRKMMDFEAVLAGKQNITSVADMNRLLMIILKGEFLRPKYHKKMIKMLLACEDRKTFAAFLPEVPLAHKTGTLDGLRGDVGIIYGKQVLLLSGFVQNFESQFQGDKILADLAKIFYDSVATP